MDKFRGVASRTASGLGPFLDGTASQGPVSDADADPIEQPDGDLNLALEQLASASRGIDLVIGQYKPLHAVQVWKMQT